MTHLDSLLESDGCRPFLLSSLSSTLAGDGIFPSALLAAAPKNLVLLTGLLALLVGELADVGRREGGGGGGGKGGEGAGAGAGAGAGDSAGSMMTRL